MILLEHFDHLILDCIILLQFDNYECLIYVGISYNILFWYFVDIGWYLDDHFYILFILMCGITVKKVEEWS